MSEIENINVVIVGGGQAGAQACQSLRTFGFAGSITLFGDEPQLPYQRPPLSKAYMKGEMPSERLYFRTADWYTEQHIEVRKGERVHGIDRASQSIKTPSGDVGYDRLVLATGSRPRPCPVPGAYLQGVHDLRMLADIEAIRPQMAARKKIVIIGAGYIGLEAAAVAKDLGLDVTVVEMADRVLARVTSPELSAFYEDAHRRRGVKIVTRASALELLGDTNVTGVRLSTGDTLEADTVLVGIGILPNQELAMEAGVECRDGILVDDNARTSDPNIFAAGDCARRPLFPYGGEGRLESVHNAIEQGKLAAAAIAGRPSPKLDCPWFWSDQYDLKLQIAGLSSGYDQVVERGDRNSESFALFYLKDRQLIAVDAVNDPAAFLASKKMIIHGARPDPDALKDGAQDLKTIAAQAIAV